MKGLSPLIDVWTKTIEDAQEEPRNVGSADVCIYDRIFRRRSLVCKSLRAPEVSPMSLVTLVILVLTVFLLGYLVVALLYPEKF